MGMIKLYAYAKLSWHDADDSQRQDFGSAHARQSKDETQIQWMET